MNDISSVVPLSLSPVMESLSIKAMFLKAATGAAKVVIVSASGITAPLLCSAVIVVGAAIIVTRIYNSDTRSRGNGSPPRPSWPSFPSPGKQTEGAGPAPGGQGHGSTARPSRSSFPSRGKQTEGTGPGPGGQEHGSTARPSRSSFLSRGVQTDGAGPSAGGQGHGSPPRSSGSSFPNCGVQTDGEGPTPDHGIHRRERTETEQGELREVHASPEAPFISQQQKKRRKGNFDLIL
ncbi:basic salivary proline-rich protein 3-like isoform X1 [Sceloporus undulatus]|uniref:basic salivary proline-rich protein 3-like isoform X1 n=1 Tax=Sceloporus undulatus TaxID=8520 RepID=UPI001C4DAD01|nr:basic salivary proline-rich protein 3-like isoform X1 [Sceloporus undulatus]